MLRRRYRAFLLLSPVALLAGGCASAPDSGLIQIDRANTHRTPSLSLVASDQLGDVFVAEHLRENAPVRTASQPIR